MLIEKTVHTKKLPIYLEKIIKEVRRKESHYTDEQKELLNTIITTLYRTELTESQRKRLLRELNGREGENMLEVLKMVERENARIKASGVREGKREGRREGRREIQYETAKKMLEKKIDVETIMEIMNLTEKQIMRLKEQA